MKYPFYTPYQFAGNKPIKYTDLDGLEENNPLPPEPDKDETQQEPLKTPQEAPNYDKDLKAQEEFNRERERTRRIFKEIRSIRSQGR